MIVLSIYIESIRTRDAFAFGPSWTRSHYPPSTPFLGDFCKRQGWDEDIQTRMAAAAEETVMVLAERDKDRTEKHPEPEGGG